MSYSTTDKELFIAEVDPPFDTVEIQFVPPEMTNNRQANLRDIQVVGRNDDLQHYVSGKETLSFVLDMYGDETFVYQRINFLKSLTMNNGFIGSFRSVKLIYGDFYPFHVWNLKGVQSKFTHFTQNLNWLPQRAQVTLNFKLDPVSNRLIEDVRNGR